MEKNRSRYHFGNDFCYNIQPYGKLYGQHSAETDIRRFCDACGRKGAAVQKNRIRQSSLRLRFQRTDYQMKRIQKTLGITAVPYSPAYYHPGRAVFVDP